MQNRQNKQLGFTLLELIIVTGMMALVSLALIYNFREGDRQKRVNLQRDNITSALRLAQNYSLSGKQIPSPTEAPHVRGNARYSCSNSNAARSFWVEFSNGNAFFDVMAEDTCGAIMRVQRYTNVQFTKFLNSDAFVVTSTSGTTNNTRVAIRFVPPFGVMSVSTASNPLPSSFAAFQTVNLNFEYQDGGRQKSVVVDGISGKME